MLWKNLETGIFNANSLSWNGVIILEYTLYRITIVDDLTPE